MVRFTGEGATYEEAVKASDLLLRLYHEDETRPPTDIRSFH
jgi:hypothetical protein